KRLTNAYSDKSPLVAAFAIREETELALYTSQDRMLVLNTAMLTPKSTRDTIGVNVVTLKGTHKVEYACLLSQSGITDAKRYRTKSIPAAGAKLLPGDARDRQLELEFE
ncbi:MAG: topoisomerase IV, partial [Oscillospiraceae bacterium]|nr:topoisomerase IV [Oscillospiraceae bacterium]